MNLEARTARRMLAAALALGVVLRLVGLGVHSLWIDEAATLYVAGSEDVVAALRGDRHPPLSFLLFKGWRMLVGEDDGWLRLAPALASIASLFLLARLARDWLDERAAWVAVAVVAVSPLDLWIAREVRMYAFVECAALLAYVGTCAHLRRPRAWTLVLVAGASAAATGLHYFGAFVGPTVAVLAHVRARAERASSRSVLWLSVAGVAGAVAWLPWFLGVYRDQAAVGAAFLSNVGPRTIVEFLARLFVPTTDLLPEGGVRVAYAAAGLVTLAGLVFVVRLVRERRADQISALVLVATGPACALLVALVGPLNFLARYFAASIPGGALVLAAGIGSLCRPWMRHVLAGALLIALATVSGFVHMRNDREDWRTACAHVQSEFRPGDRVLALTHLTDGYSQAPLRHYWRDSPDLLAALTTLPAARDALAPRPRLHVIYRETRYVEAEWTDLAARYRIVSTEALHGAIHRMVLE